MGEYYEIIYLGGKAYLEYHSEATGWQTLTQELNESQIEKAEELASENQERMNKLLKSFTD